MNRSHAHTDALASYVNAGCFCIAVILSCGCDQDDRDSVKREPGIVRSSDEVREHLEYEELFGSIVVPHLLSPEEPEAPSPIVYVIGDHEGRVKTIRRPQPDRGRWAFEEISRDPVGIEKVTEGEFSIVIVADKLLSAKKFSSLLFETQKMFSPAKLWLQVWGVHPYPLQIPIDIEVEKVMRDFGADALLQDIVNRL